MHFTITNDDGYDAAGIAVLAQVASRFGTIDVVAPLTPQSQVSHAVSLSRPLSVRSIPGGGPGPVQAVAGRPADCTRLALAGITGEQRPDWVLSGINHGANLGVDIFYSGTVAAAREAAIMGLPAISFSQLIMRPRPIDWDGAAIMVERALRAILARDCPAGSYFNVNLPSLTEGFADVPIIETAVGDDPLPLHYEPDTPPPDATDADGTYYRYAGSYTERARTAGCDIDVAFGGRISISRLSLRIQ